MKYRMKIGKYITKCKCFVFRLENLVKSIKNSNRNLVDLFSHISASIYNRHSHRFIVNIIQNINRHAHLNIVMATTLPNAYMMSFN